MMLNELLYMHNNIYIYIENVKRKNFQLYFACSQLDGIVNGIMIDKWFFTTH